MINFDCVCSMKGWYAIMEIWSWLGNQMFQYAYIRSLSSRNHINFKLNILWYDNNLFRKFELNIFKIKENYANRKDLPYYFYWSSSPIRGIAARLNHNHHLESSNYFNPIKFNPKFLNIKDWYISWSFLSEKYFVDQWDKIKDDFIFTKQISSQCRIVENTIKNLNTVSIHLRRWDYLKYPYIYPVLDYGYYDKAIKIIKENLDNPTFVIFSDDIDYANDFFKDLKNKIMIDCNRWENSRQDMYLMSKCKHNITAHSTFSWWWAYLNNNEDKIVISPKEWFVKWCHYYNNDIVPDSWIKIW